MSYYSNLYVSFGNIEQVLVSKHSGIKKNLIPE